jgi:hypothetical protein
MKDGTGSDTTWFEEHPNLCCGAARKDNLDARRHIELTVRGNVRKGVGLSKETGLRNVLSPVRAG